MTGQQLKNSILQMAASGKLVPQDPNDEPASVLLERIRAEKEQLVKEGKIKKEKNPSRIFRGSDHLPYEQIGNNEPVCIADEVPFEIPESWEWCRFGNAVINRDSERIPLSVNERSKLEKIYDYYGASGVIDKVDRFLFNKPLLLIGEDGANLLLRSKPIAFIATGQYWVNNHAHVIDTFGGLLLEYVAIYINAINLAPYVTGTAQPKMNQEKMNSILMPIPPAEEQQRIVAKIEELQPFIDEYTAKEQQTRSLNDFFPDQLRKSILQYAVQGKLVPQDPEDEPASVLLGRIRAEKEQLIAAGKIKRDKHESVIYRRDNSHYEKIDGVEHCIDDEIPFEIPENWAWCRLENIMIKITDGTHHSPPNDSNGAFMYVTAKNIKEAGVDLTDITFVSEPIHKEIYARCDPEMNDILLIKDGATAGIVTVNNLTEPFSMLSSVALLKPSRNLVTWYIVYCMRSDMFYQIVRGKMKGTGIPRITLNQIYPFLLPLPPYREQERIVQKIRQVFSNIDKISLD